MEQDIINLLKRKASAKQAIYRTTELVFLDFQNLLKAKSDRLLEAVSSKDKCIEVEYSSKGKFDAQIKFSGDTLVFHMHSNIFDFPSNHPIYKTTYVKDDELRAFCGVINVYNFLSDSLKYNRMNDSGFLIGRVFINKDNHFFVDGDEELGFLFNDFANQKIDTNKIDHIINVLMLYALNFDLQTPNFNEVKEVFVHQILDINNNHKIRTAKRMGYKFSFETKNE